MDFNFKFLEKISNLDINSVLDIGAHFGLFTTSMNELYPNAEYHMIEANINCEDKLKQIPFATYGIHLLSDSEKEICYYMNKNDITSTGNSYYRELSEHFNRDNILEVNIKSTTLDNLFFNKSFDFVKLDTQGSEIDILKGGDKFISNTKYILIECSTIQYNENSPQIEDIFYYMNSIGFNNNEELNDHIENGLVVQKDILFKR